jgi:glucosylceramidase
MQLMSDEQCAKYIDGVAVHWYLDFIVPVKVLDEVHKDFGNKIIMNTEASQGESKRLFNLHILTIHNYNHP